MYKTHGTRLGFLALVRRIPNDFLLKELDELTWNIGVSDIRGHVFAQEGRSLSIIDGVQDRRILLLSCADHGSYAPALLHAEELLLRFFDGGGCCRRRRVIGSFLLLGRRCFLGRRRWFVCIARCILSQCRIDRVGSVQCHLMSFKFSNEIRMNISLTFPGIIIVAD